MKSAAYLLITMIAIVVILACNAIRSVEILPSEEPPGVGEQAEKGYAASEPVIAALDQYWADHGAYPETLAELVPAYLLVVPATTDELDFSYSSTGDSYSFSFHYRGPGLNTCTYTPEEKWKCPGAY